MGQSITPFRGSTSRLRMDCISVLNLCSATIGLVSGGWLSFGAAFMKPSKIVESADNSWDAAPDVVGALASQSAQNLAGSLLLVIAFALQILAASIQTAISLEPPINQLEPFHFVFASVFLSLAISFPVFFLRKQWLKKQVQHHQEKKQSR